MLPVSLSSSLVYPPSSSNLLSFLFLCLAFISLRFINFGYLISFLFLFVSASTLYQLMFIVGSLVELALVMRLSFVFFSSVTSSVALA